MKAKKRNRRKFGYRGVFLIICALFWCIYPFITRVLVKKLPENEASFFANKNGVIIDLLLFSKEVAILIFSIGMVLYFLGERVFPDKVIPIDKNRIKRMKFPLIFIGGYVLLSILSFIFSDYKETVLWGVNSEYEGLIAIICYSITFIFPMIYLSKEQANEKWISGTEIFKILIMILSTIVSILTIIEIYYKPILEIPFIQDLISSDENSQIAHSIKNENFIGQICLTFNNPGFLGGFCALITPVCFAISLEFRSVKRIICIVSEAILILAVKWSDSKVAMLSLAVTLPLAFVFCLLYIRQKKTNMDIKKLLIDFISVITLGIILIVMSKVLPTYSSRVRPEGIPETQTAASDNINSLYKLSGAEIKDGTLKLYSGEKCLMVSVDKEILSDCYRYYGDKDFSECLIFSDGINELKGREPVTLKATNIRDEVNGFRLNDERFSNIYVSVDNELVIFDFGYMGTVEFYITSEGLKMFGQGSALLDDIPQPRVTGLEKFYSFGTGRGYIWIQALPILKESIFLGGGNGTFAFRFRQNEMVGLLNTHGSCKYVIDRPHNWYLQIACSDGVIALILVLGLFVLYIWNFIRFYFTKNTDSVKICRPEILDIGLFSGLVGFMVCGLINDSCITVNPLFWLLLGWAVSRQYPKSA